LYFWIQKVKQSTVGEAYCVATIDPVEQRYFGQWGLKAIGGIQMRKRIITQGTKDVIPPDQNWLDLENLAEAEVTSEDATHPIESALKPGEGPGWRASEFGQQTVRLLFDKPLRVRHIRLVFQQDGQDRTHEFVLRWSSDNGQSYREIVRQQYNFSSPQNTLEIEEYAVDLDGLTALEYPKKVSS
jgi:hypothetical protein